MKTTKTDHVTISVLLILSVVLGLFMIHGFLLAIMLGLMLKVVIKPIYEFLRTKKLGPKLAASLLLVVILVIILGPITIVFTRATNEAIKLTTALSQTQDLSLGGFADRVYNWEPLQFFAKDARDLEMQIQRGLVSAANLVGSFLLGKLSNVPSFVLQTFIAFMVCFFLLLDDVHFSKYLRDKIPLEPSLQKRISENLRRTTLSSFWATLAAASAQSLTIGFGFLILNIPAGFLAMGIAFISAWIPLVGSAPVWITASIYLYTKQMYAKMIVMVILGLLTGVIDNVVRSLVLRGRDNIHPAVGLLAIFGGISFFGITGVFVGPVIASLIITLLDLWSLVKKP